MVKLDSERSLYIRENRVHVCAEITGLLESLSAVSVLQFSSVSKRITKMFSVHTLMGCISPGLQIYVCSGS